MLNSVMEKVIQFAKTVANALGAIFGWTIEIDSGGIANDFENAGAGADEMADGTGDAADNAKKLSKYIAGWQEVNNMTTDDSKKKGSGGAGGIDTGALEAERNWFRWIPSSISTEVILIPSKVSASISA